ncbi:hypothetical protein BST27_24765 [Mycobacterium intermedium]|uniref:Uncharacterized protein n=1 Tax=Mycobacterium intermedium TaxID=28445 RepID=A0A1E3S779_MYCIE|nr:hypothetical protein BHQ20_26415 [Mycobacterium intermedium]OPE47593.1 hypothetical protein BV508_21540 [Mycobacterium intermedium]ORA96627.1 hypothetical protein BST27_24765 [Mycobacterium intermedium]
MHSESAAYRALRAAMIDPSGRDRRSRKRKCRERGALMELSWRLVDGDPPPVWTRPSSTSG